MITLSLYKFHFSILSLSQDKSLLSMFKMTTGKDLDPSMITHNDIIGLLDTLAKEHNTLGDQINVQTRNWTQKRDEICRILQDILAIHPYLVLGSYKMKGCEIVAQNLSFRNSFHNLHRTIPFVTKTTYS